MTNSLGSQKSAQSLETQAKILKVALKLFNEKGTDAVTTHDIAHGAELSPGNLYYHYKNKTAIIRALFYQIEIFSINKWWQKSPNDREVSFSDFMQFYFGAIKKYRFFFKDFSLILKNDAVLAKEWRSIYSRLFSVMRESLDGWIKQGAITPFTDSKDADTFIETIWILASYSQVHFEAREGRFRADQIDDSLRLLAKFLYPYHTLKGQRVINLYL